MQPAYLSLPTTSSSGPDMSNCEFIVKSIQSNSAFSCTTWYCTKARCEWRRKHSMFSQIVRYHKAITVQLCYSRLCVWIRDTHTHTHKMRRTKRLIKGEREYAQHCTLSFRTGLVSRSMLSIKVRHLKERTGRAINHTTVTQLSYDAVRYMLNNRHIIYSDNSQYNIYGATQLIRNHINIRT